MKTFEVTFTVQADDDATEESLLYDLQSATQELESSINGKIEDTYVTEIEGCDDGDCDEDDCDD